MHICKRFVYSKAVVLLMCICCYCYYQSLCFFLLVPSFVVQYLICNHLAGLEIAGCFSFIVLLIACGCYCSLPFPHMAVGWSTVPGAGLQCVIMTFPDHTHFLY